ncbi:hypothetical protein H7K45_18460 [Mycobacterium yunnanensis]|uniref:DUF732 domain-containing protein n=1 Tax=Mycobacterium yunnanensis TaxID=368477 RepID=A0A9X2Z4Z8_9MYCO|nr:hypothetical protein [Mycobacterium yunnanensis]MCV7422531.1 hypothetical protein [Mycobacterium yunnanensis]
MRTRVLVAAALVVVATAAAGCDRTTEGTVAMTTEAGPPLRTSTTIRPIPSAPDTTDSPTTSPTEAPAPPPGDALAITCKQYIGLDEASRTSVIREILKDQTTGLSPSEADIAKTLADAVCTFLPDSTVSEILLGETPP